MSEPVKPKGTLGVAVSDEQDKTSSVRLSGMAQAALTIALVLLGAWAAYSNHKGLADYVKDVAPWSTGGGLFTLLWGQLKSAHVLAAKEKAKTPQPQVPDTTGQPQKESGQ